MRTLACTLLLVMITLTLMAQFTGLNLGPTNTPGYGINPSPSHPCYGEGYADGQSYTCSATRDEIRKAPRWAFTAEHPPLSPRKAEQLAAAKLASLVKQPGRWILNNINLKNTGDGDHWIYDVCFTEGWPEFNSGGPPYSILHFLVLMDGTVAEMKPKSK
jgi:hypothetical protein